MHQEIRLSAVPYRDLPEETEVEPAIWQRWVPVADPNLTLPTRKLWADVDTCKARIALTRVILALGRYQRQFGRLPLSLSEMETGVSWKAPEDPFTGRALIYLLKEDGSYLLYSVGPDMRDSGGSSLCRSCLDGDVGMEVNWSEP